jgi:hypothetical protein
MSPDLGFPDVSIIFLLIGLKFCNFTKHSQNMPEENMK